MRILVTGADRPLGACLCAGLAAEGFAVRPVGQVETPPHDLGVAETYGAVDLGVPAAVAAAVAGVDAVVHAQPHDPPPSDGEGELLEAMTRGTYVLVQAARQAGVGRVVLLSQLALFESYPEDYLVQADWRPRPRPEAASLAPWLAELVCREIARAGGIEALVLRLGDLDAAAGTRATDAVRAVREALQEEGPKSGYRWAERHVASGGRFAAAGRR